MEVPHGASSLDGSSTTCYCNRPSGIRFALCKSTASDKVNKATIQQASTHDKNRSTWTHDQLRCGLIDSSDRTEGSELVCTYTRESKLFHHRWQAQEFSQSIAGHRQASFRDRDVRSPPIREDELETFQDFDRGNSI